MATGNRLTAEQLATLSPGDQVTIESGAEFGPRRRHRTGTVVRTTARCIVVRAGAYVEEYRLRDGVRVGGLGHAELVDEAAPVRTPDAVRIDVLCRHWARSRGDIAKLRELHKAIGECLKSETAPAS